MSQFLTIFFGLGILYVALTARMRTYVQVIGLQGAILFAMIIKDIGTVDWFTFGLLAFETLVFKTFIVPFMLWRIVHKTNVSRDADPQVPQFFSIVIATLMLLLGFGAAHWVSQVDSRINPLDFGVAISTMAVAFFLIITRWKLITHVMAFMLLQNAVSLLMISMSIELPVVVNLGMLLDIFTLLFIFWLLLGKMHTAYEEITKEKLMKLRDIP